MKRSAALVALSFICISFLPFCIGSDETSTGAMPGENILPRASQRAEPEICATGAHSRAAVYDFSNTYMFDRWSVVMEPGKAKLMKNIAYKNDSWTSLAQLPADQERAWHTAVYDDIDNIVIVQGGYFWKSGMASAVYAQPLYTYDGVADAWTARGPSKLPSGATAVWDTQDRCMIVCGGSEVVSGATVFHKEAWAWYPSNGTWVQLADMPAARTGQCSVWDPDDGLMLVFGGINESEYFNDVWAFRPAQNSWTVLTPVSDEAPAVRAYSSAVWNPNKKEMLVHGGENATVTFLSTWAFSYANNGWIHRTSSPWAHSMIAACWNSDRGVMTVFGGRYNIGSNQYEYYNNTWTYDPESDSWNQLSNAFLPGAYRAGCAGVYDPVNKRMLVIGGRAPDALGGDCLRQNWAFTLGQINWSYFSPGYMQPPIVDLGSDYFSLDKASWTQQLPAGTALLFRIRTSFDNTTFRSFANLDNGARPSQQGRYLIWNVTFSSSVDRQATPVVSGVRIDYTVNAPPLAAAGDNASAYKAEAVTLHGNGSDPDGDTLTYKWTKLSSLAGTFDDPTLREPRYTPLASGVHNLQLVVNDSFVEVASFVKVTVSNRPPLASAGPDRTAYKKENITLEGNATDPDGDLLFINWTQLAGPKVAITPGNALRPTIIAEKGGNYTFQLKVDDGENVTYGNVNITVLDRPPVAVLQASPTRININGNVNFSAKTSSDPDGNLTKYLIEFGDGNDSGWTTKAELVYAYTRPGVYEAIARVIDDDNSLSMPSAPVTITVENARPVINGSVVPAKGNVSTGFRFMVSTSSYDPDGKIVSYEWRFGDGQTDNGSTVTHTYSKRGNYTVTLRATDDFGGFTDIRLNVTVAGRPPLVTSTSPADVQTISLGGKLSFAISAQDPDGESLHFAWKTDGVLTGTDSSSLDYKASRSGAHSVSVTVSDGEDSISYEWKVTVKPVDGEKPTTPVLLIMALVAVITVVVILGVLAMRRKKGP